jgi:dTDP-4-dehydrorhamnose reductase
MKILLLGKTGLLGQSLFSALPKDHEVFAPTHAECDITKLETIKKIIDEQKPEVVINAVGYTQVDKAEHEKDLAYKLNSRGVLNIINCIKSTNIELVHFSTDYVFDGTKKVGYQESDKTNPLSVYGASKAEAEAEILKDLTNFYLVRTSWVFGPGGKNFVDTMLNLAKKHEPIKVVNDQTGCPTLTLDLAEAVLALLKTKKYGIYHLVNDGSCSWYEYACEIFNQLGISQEVLPITSQELKRDAVRPQNSILLNTKAPKLRNWKEALTAYLTDKSLIL